MADKSKLGLILQRVGWFFGLLIQLVDSGKEYNEKNSYPSSSTSPSGSPLGNNKPKETFEKEPSNESGE